MAGGEENDREGNCEERLTPSREPPEQLAQGRPEEQPQLSPPGQEDHEEEEGEGEEESQRSEGRFEGVLDEDTAAEGLHRLGCSAPGLEYVYLDLFLSGRELRDIQILCGFVHLQKLDLSYNKINDLSCVSHMPYLLELDASHNELTECFGFKPPKNLKEADFSYNQISKMQDLSAYQCLTKLFLDFNNIREIKGLEKCHSLTHLSLSHNSLRAISGLENLPLRILNLGFNQIEKATGLESLKTLQQLDLSSNKITSLRGLQGHDLLETINLEDNQVAELPELKWIEGLPLLRVLNLLKNPLQEQADYWLSAIFAVLQVTELDLKKVAVKEKVAAVNKYDPPPEVVAAEDHRSLVMYHMTQPQKILHSTLPGLDSSYPMLVLVGPVSCGKRELTHKICRQFNNFFRFGPCHTTRRPYFGEENRLDYYFISQEAFEEMVESGRFLATYKYSGHLYGLGRDTLESIAREGLGTCVHLEIEGVRSLKCTYFKPRYVLVVPADKEKYETHLRRTGLFSRPEIEEAVSRVDMYLQISQDSPGYFDAVINTDDLDEAFTELSLLMKMFLNLELPAAFDDIQDTRSRAGSRTQLLSPGGVIRSPSVSDLLDSPTKKYPKAFLDIEAAPPGSVEEASLERRFSTTRQALSWKAPPAPLQLLPREAAPAADGRRGPNTHHPEGPKAEHQDPRGAGNSRGRLKGAGESLQRKSSKAKSRELFGRGILGDVQR
ncbi:leucine-rich repeat and guanylate kinase domain-containing protein isoform X2 [Pseudopipra pipra]|uniref:leucine-rich repeat and guanylate kinase domain-containing protein isoform X2 n=1 Tax=Pseudopipra pipra TaxID=415032 RepID=UPI0031398BAB